MRIWNVSEKEINHLYNNRIIIVKANSVLDVSDDTGLFLLNNREIRGHGLIELRDGDNKAECYKQGRRQIYQWATNKYNDYLRHCEEREAQRLQPLNPHKEILEYKNIIDDFNEWVKAGEPVKEEYKEIVGEKRIFACPYCSLEFPNKEDYLQHIPLHNKETSNANAGAITDTGQGKS